MTTRQEKHCPRCERDLPIEAFYLTRSRPTGSAYCKVCMKAYDRAHWQQLPARAKRRRLDRTLAWQQRMAGDPDWRAHRNARRRQRYRDARPRRGRPRQVAWTDARGIPVPPLTTYPVAPPVALVWTEQGWERA